MHMLKPGPCMCTSRSLHARGKILLKVDPCIKLDACACPAREQVRPLYLRGEIRSALHALPMYVRGYAAGGGVLRARGDSLGMMPRVGRLCLVREDISLREG
jgi:hypothetical protein